MPLLRPDAQARKDANSPGPLPPGSPSSGTRRRLGDHCWPGMELTRKTGGLDPNAGFNLRAVQVNLGLSRFSQPERVSPALEQGPHEPRQTHGLAGERGAAVRPLIRAPQRICASWEEPDLLGSQQGPERVACDPRHQLTFPGTARSTPAVAMMLPHANCPAGLRPAHGRGTLSGASVLWWRWPQGRGGGARMTPSPCLRYGDPAADAESTAPFSSHSAPFS